MYKLFTNNAKKVVISIKKHQGDDLKTVPATQLIEAILQHNGSYGKNIINSLAPEVKEKIIKKLKEGSSLTASELLAEASKLAYLTKSRLIGTEHIVQAFIEKELSLSENNNAGNHNIPEGFPPIPKEMQKEINNLLNDLFPQSIEPEQQNILKLYCSDLNSTTKQHHPPLIGKTDELARITHILARKNKNNPILLGDPGVGKTAIVEGLAKNINDLNVPEHLINKKILSLDLSQLVAGTSFRGEFESRLKEIMYVLEQDKNIILFIDEIHMLMGAGNSVGGMDAANILKPALSRGTIQIIGATTVEEYKKSIAKDSALERRFQPLIVPEASQQETVKILQGIKKYYEKYHQVSFSEEAIVSSAKLAQKYITNRFLPDSAIDLLDETAARKRSQLINNPKYKKYIINKQRVAEIKKMKETLLMNNNYEEAFRLKDEEYKLKKLLEKERPLQSKKISQKINIESQDILDTLSLITNISPKLLKVHNSDLTNQVGKLLQKKLIGQKHIKKTIQETILRRLSGLSRQRGPLGSFVFIGPSGVGKTMTAKLLAQAISPTDKPSLIQINMSEFTEKHTLSRLLGAPAGYVGHENEGELSAKIYRNPFSVILFDEIEKADPSILNILLQILEEGELVDARNKRIDFKNTLIILTSNIGTEALDYLSNIGFTSTNSKKTPDKKQVKESILEELQEQLPAELLARIDNTLIFNNLERKDIKKIVQLFLNELKRKLKKRQIILTLDKKVIDFLTDKSVALNQGARLVRKNIQDFVEPVLAKELLKKKPTKNIKLSLNKQGNRVIIGTPHV